MPHIFDTCKHIWEFHIDASKSGGPVNTPWKSFYICKSCHSVITLEEKCSLEQTEAIKESLKLQEGSLETAKKAMIISAVMMIIAVVGLYLEKIFN